MPTPTRIERERRQHRVVPVPGMVAPTTETPVALVLPARESPPREEQRVPATTATAPTTGVPVPGGRNHGVPAMLPPAVTAAHEPPATATRRHPVPAMPATTDSGHLRPPSMGLARPAAESPPRHNRPAFSLLASAPGADGFHDATVLLHRTLPGGELPAPTAAPTGVRLERACSHRGRQKRIPTPRNRIGIVIPATAGREILRVVWPYLTSTPSPVSPPSSLPTRIERGEQKAHHPS